MNIEEKINNKFIYYIYEVYHNISRFPLKLYYIGKCLHHTESLDEAILYYLCYNNIELVNKDIDNPECVKSYIYLFKSKDIIEYFNITYELDMECLCYTSCINTITGDFYFYERLNRDKDIINKIKDHEYIKLIKDYYKNVLFCFRPFSHIL